MSGHEPTATITLQWPGRAQERSRTSPARTPRVARLLALGHEIERRIRLGELDDLAHAARVLGVTRARVTQVANLVLLSPQIQDKILAMPPVATGREMIAERMLRAVVVEPNWKQQLVMWPSLTGADHSPCEVEFSTEPASSVSGRTSQ